MISKRLKYIASFVDDSDYVLDIGTDHAYLPIYLIKNKITSIADGSDISEKVLQNAKENIIKHNLESKINLYLSDGLNEIDVTKYNTLIITGMGFYTIKEILNRNLLISINKLIIQSNNNVDEMRKYLNSINFKIISDKYIFDKNKPYSIITAVKGKQRLSKIEYICGIYDKDNIEYYKFMHDKLNDILLGIKNGANKKIKKEIKYYSKYLSK